MSVPHARGRSRRRADGRRASIFVEHGLHAAGGLGDNTPSASGSGGDGGAGEAGGHGGSGAGGHGGLSFGVYKSGTSVPTFAGNTVFNIGSGGAGGAAGVAPPSNLGQAGSAGSSGNVN
jgi:hypothetical protein